MIKGNKIFSIKETLYILKNILYIEENELEDYVKNKNQLNFLNSLVKSYQENIPFHNIFLLTSPIKQRFVFVFILFFQLFCSKIQDSISNKGQV